MEDELDFQAVGLLMVEKKRSRWQDRTGWERSNTVNVPFVLFVFVVDGQERTRAGDLSRNSGSSSINFKRALTTVGILKRIK